MATTKYTSTVNVPVFAGWLCPKCREINFSQGKIEYSKTTSSSSLSGEKQEAARNKARDEANSGWMDNAIGIMFRPRENAGIFRDRLKLENYSCKQCGAKPVWKGGKLANVIAMIMLLFGLLMFIVGCSEGGSVSLWIGLGVNTALLVLILVADSSAYKRKLQNIPDEYMPVISTLNPELLSYSEFRRIKMPTPQETVQRLENNRARVAVQFQQQYPQQQYPQQQYPQQQYPQQQYPQQQYPQQQYPQQQYPQQQNPQQQYPNQPNN